MDRPRGAVEDAEIGAPVASDWPPSNALARAGFVAFVAAGTSYMLIGNELLLTLAQLTGAGLLVLSLLSVRRAELFVYMVVLGSVLALLMRSIVHGEFYTLVLASYFIAGAGAALALRQQRVSIRALQVVHALALLWFLWLALRGVSAEYALPGRSRNHVSTLVLALGLTVNLAQLRQRGSITLLPAGAALLASTWAVGRAGILASLVYFLGAVWIRRRSLTWVQVSAGVAAALAVAAWVTVRYGAAVAAFVELSTLKLRQRGLESFERVEIITTYLGELDGLTVLFGMSDDFLQIIGLTIHNSFLQMHYLLGLMGLVLYGLIGMAIVRGMLRDRVHLLLLLVILLRAATDTVLFPGILLDAPFLYLLTALLLPEKTYASAPTVGTDAESDEHHLAQASG